MCVFLPLLGVPKFVLALACLRVPPPPLARARFLVRTRPLPLSPVQLLHDSCGRRGVGGSQLHRGPAAAGAVAGAPYQHPWCARVPGPFRGRRVELPGGVCGGSHVPIAPRCVLVYVCLRLLVRACVCASVRACICMPPACRSRSPASGACDGVDAAPTASSRPTSGDTLFLMYLLVASPPPLRCAFQIPWRSSTPRSSQCSGPTRAYCPPATPLWWPESTPTPAVGARGRRGATKVTFAWRGSGFRARVAGTATSGCVMPSRVACAPRAVGGSLCVRVGPQHPRWHGRDFFTPGVARWHVFVAQVRG
jgi:hypothetical protein